MTNEPRPEGTSPRATGSGAGANDALATVALLLQRERQHQSLLVRMLRDTRQRLREVHAALSGSEQQRTKLESAISSLREELATTKSCPNRGMEEALMSENEISLKEKKSAHEEGHIKRDPKWVIPVILLAAMVAGKWGHSIFYGNSWWVCISLTVAAIAWFLLSKIVSAADEGRTVLDVLTLRDGDLDERLKNDDDFTGLHIEQQRSSWFHLRRPLTGTDMSSQGLDTLAYTAHTSLEKLSAFKKGDLKKAQEAVEEHNDELRKLRRSKNKAQAELNTAKEAQDESPTDDQKKAVAEADSKLQTATRALSEGEEKLKKLNKTLTSAQKEREALKVKFEQDREPVQQAVDRLFVQAGAKFALGFTPRLARGLRFCVVMAILWAGLQMPTMLHHTLQDRNHHTFAWMVSPLAPELNRVKAEQREVKLDKGDPRLELANDQGEVTLITLWFIGEKPKNPVYQINDEEKGKK